MNLLTKYKKTITIFVIGLIIHSIMYWFMKDDPSKLEILIMSWTGLLWGQCTWMGIAAENENPL